jgi:hypothetical protein
MNVNEISINTEEKNKRIFFLFFFYSTDVMTSSTIDGIKRSNVCGDGYRIEGALLKSYPYTKSQSYLPYEDCSMTFKARRSDNKIRIRILSLDLNDIHGGVNCLDSLRFYKSVYVARKDKLVCSYPTTNRSY